MQDLGGTVLNLASAVTALEGQTTLNPGTRHRKPVVVLYTARSINEGIEIVVTGTVNGVSGAFVLTPVA
jgi:hypothetical protein